VLPPRHKCRDTGGNSAIRDTPRLPGVHAEVSGSGDGHPVVARFQGGHAVSSLPAAALVGCPSLGSLTGNCVYQQASTGKHTPSHMVNTHTVKRVRIGIATPTFPLIRISGIGRNLLPNPYKITELAFFSGLWTSPQPFHLPPDCLACQSEIECDGRSVFLPTHPGGNLPVKMFQDRLGQDGFAWAMP